MFFREPFPLDFLKKVSKRLSYLRYPTRLRILQLLDAYGPKTARIIREKTGIDHPFIIRAFSVLRKNNIILTSKKNHLILYRLEDEIIAQILFSLRKVFGSLSNDLRYIVDIEYKNMPPKEFSQMSAKQIKSMANLERLKILDFLFINGQSSFENMTQTIGKSKNIMLLNLLYLESKGMLKSAFNGKQTLYKMTDGIHKALLQQLHQYYDKCSVKEDF